MIRRLYPNGWTQEALAREGGIKQQTVSRIVSSASKSCSVSIGLGSWLVGAPTSPATPGTKPSATTSRYSTRASEMHSRAMAAVSAMSISSPRPAA
ncbi:helix-turn-helix domain-containing protein [Nocardia asiatica]